MSTKVSDVNEASKASKASSAAPAGAETGAQAGKFTLYCFAQSGNAYKCALALQLTGADWTPRFVDYFGGEAGSRAYRDINIMGEAPVLEHRGMRLSQSGVILDYLAESLGRFGPAEAVERREIWRWLLWDNHKLTSFTATLRFMRTFVEKPEAAVVAYLRGRAETAWGVGGGHLAGRRTHGGERRTKTHNSDLC
jgi:glutathione S-transferase